MPLTSGVAEMLTSLKNIGSVFVIVSDANLLNLFDKIFTNPAEFDENGRLNMRPFTEQVVLHLHWIFCKNQNQWEISAILLFINLRQSFSLKLA